MVQVLSTQKPIQVRNHQAILLKDVTMLEALFFANITGKTLAPNSFFSKLFLEKAAERQSEPLPLEIRNADFFFTGTLFAVGPNGEGSSYPITVETSFEGQRKKLILRRSVARDLVFMCDQGFENGKPSINLIDADTSESITTLEQMREASEVILSISCDSRLWKILNRNCGFFEKVNGISTFSWIPESQALGFIARDYSATDSKVGCDLNFGSYYDSFETGSALVLDNWKKMENEPESTLDKLLNLLSNMPVITAAEAILGRYLHL